MKFKLDENIDVRIVEQFHSRGHEAETVRDEGLQGRADEEIFRVCKAEQRTLVTLDLDFSNPFRFPPSSEGGTIIIRAPVPSLGMIRDLCGAALDHVPRESPLGAIWVVEPGRVRIWRSWDDDE